MRGLEGKRFLIAGSATGIGAATARRLVEEGAKVFLGDINEDGVAQFAKEIGAPWRRFDMADGESIARLVEAAVVELGGLDGLANVAADLSPATAGRDNPVDDMDEAIWLRTLDVNLVGFARTAKLALRI